MITVETWELDLKSEITSAPRNSYRRDSHRHRRCARSARGISGVGSFKRFLKIGKTISIRIAEGIGVPSEKIEFEGIIDGIEIFISDGWRWERSDRRRNDFDPNSCSGGKIGPIIKG